MRDEENLGGTRQGSGRPGDPAEASEATRADRNGHARPPLSTDAERDRQNNDDPSRVPESGDPD
jgi:hypothetical protein